MTDLGSENPILRVPAEYTEFSLLEQMAITMGNVEPGLPEAEFAGKLRLLEYAKRIGMTVLVGKPEDYEPGEYTVMGLARTKAEEEAQVLAAAPDIRMPRTTTYDEYSQAPHFPVVAKGVGSGGDLKYLLEEPEQWQKLHTWMNNGKLRQAGSRVPTYFRSVEDYEYPTRTYGNDLTKVFEYQDFIDTPSDRYTSYRVLATPNGSILTSSLYYSAATKSSPDIMISSGRIEELGTLGGALSDFLIHPSSLVFLGAKKFLSNQVRGGNGVVLSPNADSKPATETDKSVLLAHDLDPENPQLPSVVAERSSAIARAIGPSQGIVMGIDWLQEAGTGNYYYLETNFGPGPVAFADAYLGGEITDDFALIRARVAMEQAALRSLVRLDA